MKTRNVPRPIGQALGWAVALAAAQLPLSDALGLFGSSYAEEAIPSGDIVSIDGSVFSRTDDGAKKIRPLKPGDVLYSQDIVNTASDGRVKILMRDKSIVDLGPSSLFRVDHYDGKKGTDREVEVSLSYGTLRAAIAQKLTGKGKFKVRTPSATMGVRGTEFVVQSQVSDLKQLSYISSHPNAPLPASLSQGGSTSVTVLQGQVALSQHNFDASANAPLTGSRAPSSLATLGTLGKPQNPGVVNLSAGNQLTTGQSARGTNASPLNQPVSMDAKQLASIATSAHVSDLTFQKAVTIDDHALSGNGSGNNGGASLSPAISGSLAQALATALVSVPPPPRINAGDVGIPGAFTTNQALNPPSVNTQAPSHSLKIVILGGSSTAR